MGFNTCSINSIVQFVQKINKCQTNNISKLNWELYYASFACDPPLQWFMHHARFLIPPSCTRIFAETFCGNWVLKVCSVCNGVCRKGPIWYNPLGTVYLCTKFSVVCCAWLTAEIPHVQPFVPFTFQYWLAKSFAARLQTCTFTLAVCTLPVPQLCIVSICHATIDEMPSQKTNWSEIWMASTISIAPLKYVCVECMNILVNCTCSKKLNVYHCISYYHGSPVG